MKFEHSTNRERINIGLAYIQSLDNPYNLMLYLFNEDS